MKIGLTGTMSCGKTTLVKSLSQLPQFKNYEFAVERSKYLRDLGIPLDTDSTLKGQNIFLSERCVELMKENIITDRTIYDVIAFTLEAESISPKEKTLFNLYASQFAHEYDYIIYVSPEGMDIEDNGVRSTDPLYRNRIDQRILSLLKSFPPKNLIEVKGSNEERIETILKHIL